jgi:Chalcone isomerase-like
MTDRRHALLALAALVAQGGAARAQPAPPPELADEWPAVTPRRVGQGALRFWGLSVYEATLWAPAPIDAMSLGSARLALSLTYQRALVGERIAERSLEEMRRAGPLDEAQAARWLSAMKRLFPDVSAGDRLTGVLRPGEGARFHLNGVFRGELPDPRFAALFFGIWLAPWTSEPRLRQQLLGSAG